MIAQPSSSRPQLRLFSPEGSSEPTLSQVFEQVCSHCLPEARPRNLDQYRESLRLWERYTGSVPARTIDRNVARSFREALEARLWRGKQIESNTVRKHCIQVQAAIAMAGPATPEREDAAGVLEVAPKIKKPKLVHRTVKILTMEQIGAWLDVCHLATMPEVPGVSPPEWWRGAILFDYNCPFRLESLLHLRREWMEKFGTETWVTVPAWALKGRQSEMQFYLNQHALAALERVQGTGGEMIFPMPSSLSWFHTQRRKLIAAAGLSRVGFHTLRKTCNTELKKRNEAAARLHLGHSRGKDVNDDFYTHQSIVVEPVNSLPQPIWHPDREGRQFLLF